MISPKFDGTNGKIRAPEVCHGRMAQMGHIKAVCRRDELRGRRAALYDPLVYRR
jgi:hypothetical protein